MQTKMFYAPMQESQAELLALGRTGIPPYGLQVREYFGGGTGRLEVLEDLRVEECRSLGSVDGGADMSMVMA